MLLELLGDLVVAETNGIVSGLHLSVSKVLAEEVEGTVASSRFLLIRK